MNPNIDTSIVLFDRLNRENWGNKFWFKLLYFDFLNCLDVTAFDSWQIVNSRVDIVFRCLMAMSGCSEMNRVESGLYEGSSRSMKTSRFSLAVASIHLAPVSPTRDHGEICIFGELTESCNCFSVCLFVWTDPHSSHLSDSVFLHRHKFEAVGNCCWNAFLTNAKRTSGRLLHMVDHA